MVFVGGDVQVCEYAPTGSDKLGVEAVKNLADPSATLLANHGMASIGADPQSALRVAALVEKVAKIVIGARSLGPEHSLPDESQRGFADVYKILRPTSLP